jgi:RNA polymerase sigma-70 factor, ECF subfamily
MGGMDVDVRAVVERAAPRGEGAESLDGDEVAEIYRRYGPRLLRRCRRVLRDDALAEDALQDAFVKLMRHGAAYRDADSKLGWLRRVVDNCCFDVRERRQRSPVTGEEPRLRYLRPTGAAEVQAQARSLLGRLRHSEQAVTVLAYVEGASQGQIADELGRCRQSINKKLQLLRARFRRWARASEPL